MKPIENIAIVGFGSLGAMYAGCFGAAMGPERVFVVADTARTERYRAEAATFNGEPIRVTYLTYDEAAERAAEDPFDVVLYAVKYGALPEAIEQSAPLVGPDTAIISVLNGVTSEEVLAERFGWDRVLLCVAQQMDSRKVGATVTAGCVGVMALGVHDAQDAAQRANLERVAEWLTAIDQPFITPVCRACARMCWRAVPRRWSSSRAPSTAWARPTASPRPKTSASTPPSRNSKAPSRRGEPRFALVKHVDLA